MSFKHAFWRLAIDNARKPFFPPYSLSAEVEVLVTSPDIKPKKMTMSHFSMNLIIKISSCLNARLIALIICMYRLLYCKLINKDFIFLLGYKVLKNIRMHLSSASGHDWSKPRQISPEKCVFNWVLRNSCSSSDSSTMVWAFLQPKKYT